MSNLHLRIEGDPLLKEISKPISFFLKFPVEEMIRIMEENSGIAIAAPQVGISERYFIWRVDMIPEVIINPEILETSKEMVTSEEGCLSKPGFFTDVERYAWIKIKYTDEQRNDHIEIFSGLRSIVAQHEIDHLNGVCIFDEKEEKIYRE